MLFEEHITVETTHVATAPKEATIKIAHGVITWISILFPTGCHNLVHCTLYHHEHQIAPSTLGMSIVGDTKPIEWVEFYESKQPAYEIKAKLWGVGCSYPHLVTIRIAVLPRKAVVPTALTDFIARFFGLLNPIRLLPIPKREDLNNG